MAKSKGIKSAATKPRRARSIKGQLGNQEIARRKPKVRPGRLARLGALLRSWPVRLTAAMALTSIFLLTAWSAALLSPLFKVRQASVSGNQQLTKLEVLSAAAIGSDDNLLTLRTHRVEKRLNHLGWVSQAQVRRSFPNSVKIELEERRAAALAHTEQGDFYLDASLALIGPVTHGLPPDLPWITGLSRAEHFRPDQEARRLLAAAAELLNTNRQPALGRVSEVNLDRVWGLSLVMDEITATLRLGLEDPLSAWGAALTVFADLKRRGELMRATMIDLSGRKRIVVRLGREKA